MEIEYNNSEVLKMASFRRGESTVGKKIYQKSQEGISKFGVPITIASFICMQ